MFIIIHKNEYLCNREFRKSKKFFAGVKLRNGVESCILEYTVCAGDSAGNYKSDAGKDTGKF